MEFLTEKSLNQLESAVLCLKQNIYDSLTNQNKFKALHQYTFFVTLVLKEMKHDSKWQHYFIKDTIHTLINLIHNYSDSEKIFISVCNFLMEFVQHIVPDFSETFSPLLSMTVNNLKYFYKNLDCVKALCLQLMHFMIVENSCQLMDAIEKLDNFPDVPEFASIRTVHTSIKYGMSKPTLEKEITSFLEHQDVSTKFDSLVNLRKVLANHNDELKRMYDELQRHRQFSEICEISLLHRLITVLVNMGRSNNEKVIFLYYFEILFKVLNKTGKEG